MKFMKNIEVKRERRQQATYLCELMAKSEAWVLAKGHVLPRTKMNRRLWRVMITHVLQEYGTKKKVHCDTTYFYANFTFRITIIA